MAAKLALVPSPPARILLTTKQASEYTGLAVRTFECWRWEGKGPLYLKLGGAVRYEQSTLDAWLDGCTVAATEGDAR